MLYEVCLHRASGRRGALAPAGAVAWSARERAEFAIFTLELSPADLAGLLDGRRAVTPAGELVDLPPAAGPSE